MKFSPTAAVLGGFAITTLALAAPREAVGAAAGYVVGTPPPHGPTMTAKDADHHVMTSTENTPADTFPGTVYLPTPATESIKYCGNGNCTLFPASIKGEDLNAPKAITTLKTATSSAKPTKITDHGLVAPPVGVQIKQHRNKGNEGWNGWLNRHIYSKRAAPAAATPTESSKPACTGGRHLTLQGGKLIIVPDCPEDTVNTPIKRDDAAAENAATTSSSICADGEFLAVHKGACVKHYMHAEIHNATTEAETEDEDEDKDEDDYEDNSPPPYPNSGEELAIQLHDNNTFYAVRDGTSYEAIVLDNPDLVDHREGKLEIIAVDGPDGWTGVNDATIDELAETLFYAVDYGRHMTNKVKVVRSVDGGLEVAAVDGEFGWWTLKPVPSTPDVAEEDEESAVMKAFRYGYDQMVDAINAGRLRLAMMSRESEGVGGSASWWYGCRVLAGGPY